jgi:type III secretory pathway component EscS
MKRRHIEQALPHLNSIMRQRAVLDAGVAMVVVVPAIQAAGFVGIFVGFLRSTS